MAILDILNYPDPRLHTMAKPVKAVDATIRRLIEDMAETMYDAPGIGLAATQVNQHIQLIIIDTSETKDHLQVFINPKIIAKSVKVEALDKDGKKFTLSANGLLSVCIQHEIDHLLGKVFVDYLSPLKRNRIKNKMLKQNRGNDQTRSRHVNI